MTNLQNIIYDEAMKQIKSNYWHDSPVECIVENTGLNYRTVASVLGSLFRKKLIRYQYGVVRLDIAFSQEEDYRIEAKKRLTLLGVKK